VIEPFAGSMAYTLTHRPRFAIGVELDEQVVKLWNRVCGMSRAELETFPPPVVGERTKDLWVYGSAVSAWNLDVSYRTVTPFMINRFEEQRRMALRHHDYATRSVLYAPGDYREAPDVECTWFIDPPYRGVPQSYRHTDLDYDELAAWCSTRQGQVIICEGPDGDWLPFAKHRQWQGVPTYGVERRPIVEHVHVRRTHARCEQCGKTFPASRSDARLCSGKCRQRALRARR
jgi:hypothetical protein